MKRKQNAINLKTSKNEKEFEEILQKITDQTGLDEYEISVKAGRNRGYISQLRSRKQGFPDKFIQQLKEVFINPKKETQTVTQDPLNIALMNLSEANKGLVVHIGTVIKSNSTLVESNATLTGKVSSGADTPLGIPESQMPVIKAKLKKIAKAGLKGWQDESQALEEISNIFYAEFPPGVKGGMSVGANKRNN